MLVAGIECVAQDVIYGNLDYSGYKKITKGAFWSKRPEIKKMYNGEEVSGYEIITLNTPHFICFAEGEHNSGDKNYIVFPKGETICHKLSTGEYFAALCGNRIKSMYPTENTKFIDRQNKTINLVDTISQTVYKFDTIVNTVVYENNTYRNNNQQTENYYGSGQSFEPLSYFRLSWNYWPVVNYGSMPTMYCQQHDVNVNVKVINSNTNTNTNTFSWYARGVDPVNPPNPGGHGVDPTQPNPGGHGVDPARASGEGGGYDPQRGGSGTDPLLRRAAHEEPPLQVQRSQPNQQQQRAEQQQSSQQPQMQQRSQPTQQQQRAEQQHQKMQQRAEQRQTQRWQQQQQQRYQPVQQKMQSQQQQRYQPVQQKMQQQPQRSQQMQQQRSQQPQMQQRSQSYGGGANRRLR